MVPDLISANDKIPRLALETLWRYMQMHQQPRDCDVLIILGSIDDRVAWVATQLYGHYECGAVVTMGGRVARNNRQASWDEPTEAEHFTRIFRDNCNVRGKVILEPKAQRPGSPVLSCSFFVSIGEEVLRSLNFLWMSLSGLYSKISLTCPSVPSAIGKLALLCHVM